jgi:hypothetical protein
MCDHTIGYLHNFVTESEVKDVLASEARGWNSYAQTMNSFGEDHKTDYKPRDFLDRRRGLLTMFNNCPNCGEKIKWKAIKAEISTLT